MFLTLGIDSIKVAGSSHDGELAEARSLASHRWSKLLDMEQQLQRDAATVAARPKQRPAQPSDDTVPDRTLEKWNAAWVAETEGMREQLKLLKGQSEAERRELEKLAKR